MVSFSSCVLAAVLFLSISVQDAVAQPDTTVEQETDAQETDAQETDARGDASNTAAPAEATPDATNSDETGVSSTTNSEGAPVNVRLRSLEQRVQALKERAWRAKARVGGLKEAVLGGGVGARAGIFHINKMGNSYRLVKLVYALDGAQIFARNDPSGALHKDKKLDILTGPIAPGGHTLSVLAVYRGHGYGVFNYLNKYKFTVRSSHSFTTTEGKGTTINVVAFERGGVTTPLDKRPAIDFKVSLSGIGKAN